MEDVVSGDDYSDGGFYGDYNAMINFQQTKVALGEVCCWDYVGVKREVFEVCIFVGSVSLVADGF